MSVCLSVLQCRTLPENGSTGSVLLNPEVSFIHEIQTYSEARPASYPEVAGTARRQ